MEHLLLKAATTATDQGIFEAVISTATVDRDKDIIEPEALVKSLGKWTDIGKLVPLAWAHTEEVVGHIDPATVRVEDNEVIAKGKVDQSTDRGTETWRLMKSGTLSFSFGFLFDPDKDATKIAGGGLRITNLDVFEISVVPVGPANNDTRVLSWKSQGDVLTELLEVSKRLTDVAEQQGKTIAALTDRLAALEDQKTPAEGTDKETKTSRSVDPLRQQAETLALEVASGGLDLRKPPPTKNAPKPELMPLGQLKQRMRDEMLGVLSGGINDEPV